MIFKNLLKSISMVAVATVCVAISSCNNDDNNEVANQVVLKNNSATPAFVKKQAGFESLEVYSLIGSDDVLAQSPSFVFGGSADGLGILKNDDGTYTMLTNHEDNFAVSRVILDKTFKPVKGEYLMNSNAGVWRLCSATLATPAEHGFGPVFLTCGESNQESRTHAISPNALPFTTGSNGTPTITEQPAFGRFNAENALPLAKDAYTGKTVILIGDDDSGTYGGQVAMFTNESVGNLNSGKVYYMRRTDLNQKESDIVLNQTYDVEFVEVPNAANLTGLQLNEQVDVLKAIKFGRVEDLDYRRGGGDKSREIYFNVTGQNNTGVNADNSRTKYGKTYRLKMNAADRLKGTLEVILDGNKTTGNATEFQNPDNICVTENYVYVQEDANSYGDETHDAYIYQYNIATKELKKVIELDHRRTAADAATYNVGGTSGFGRWEYGAMIDISDLIGIPNTFAICIQPHTWTGDKYKGVDGGTVRPGENQASQIVIIKGLAK